MRTAVIVLLLASMSFGGPVSARPPRGEIGNLAAFARLYGVVRYFYPSDAAASLDWDRFAVHGVKLVRAARSRQDLQHSLEALFAPLGPGIEIGTTLPVRPDAGPADASLVAWRYLGPGLSAPSAMSPYRAKRTNRSAPAGVGVIDGFITIMQTTPAASLRGKTIRLRAQARATVRDPTGSAALWLRVDRPGGAMGFFDNMGDRPIRVPDWREYAIEGTVAEDATIVAFGAMAFGAVTAADFDAVELAVRGSGGTWTPVPVDDAGFEASAQDAPRGWVRAGTSASAEVSRPLGDPPEGRQFLRLAPPAAPATTGELFDSVPLHGAQMTIDLGSGLRARVPLALTDAEAAAPAQASAALDALRAALDVGQTSTDLPDLDTRLAGVVVAWNVFRHFYPYWTEAGVDWDQRLQPQLELAYAATTRATQHEALSRLVADARDGHGTVVDTRGTTRRAWLPIQLQVVDARLVITASDTDLPVGAIVSTIDGVPALERLAGATRLASGTTQWTRARALREITTCDKDAIVTIAVDGPDGPRQASLRCVTTFPPAEKRPDAVTELAPGIYYVDLTRAPMAAIAPVLPALSAARAVLFDLRGYPTDAGGRILPHLLAAAENDRWMHVAKITGPFGQIVGWESAGWNVAPEAPRLSGTIVFLTDERAISYAESVMGYVADRKLGTIVGSNTAGANGNVVTFPVPGDFSVSFTGMRVTGHDGRAPFHLVGVKPDVPVVPTLQGLRDGRDEVLERALALARDRVVGK